jgi:hypothetical protein
MKISSVREFRGQARRAVGLVRDRVTWQGCGPQECHCNAFFEGEVEPRLVRGPNPHADTSVAGTTRSLPEQLS